MLRDFRGFGSVGGSVVDYVSANVGLLRHLKIT
jgi:hypothetical protein